jgi:hypothetical protein
MSMEKKPNTSPTQFNNVEQIPIKCTPNIYYID